jgi:hypothetical protein
MLSEGKNRSHQEAYVWIPLTFKCINIMFTLSVGIERSLFCGPAAEEVGV